MSFIGKKFPDITVRCTQYGYESNSIRLNSNYEPYQKYHLLFWYPKDFTYVCPTELFELQSKIVEFEKLNVDVFGASCDTIDVHNAWLDIPKENGGINGITFRLISDSTRELSRELGILDINRNNPEYENVTYRATYILDPDYVVIYESVYPMNVGRNIDEYIRFINAYKSSIENQGVCPSNWKPGDETMKPTKDGLINYISK